CCLFFSSRRRHTRFSRDWSSDVCSSDLTLSMPVARTVGYPPVGYRTVAPFRPGTDRTADYPEVRATECQWSRLERKSSEMVHVRLEREWTDGDGNTHPAGATVDVDPATLAKLEAEGIVAEPQSWIGITGQPGGDRT